TYLSRPYLPFPIAPPPATPALSLHDALPIWLRPSNEEAERRRIPPIRGLGRWKDTTHKGGRRHGCLPKGVSLLLKATLPTCAPRSEEHTSELQSRFDLVCRLLRARKRHRRTQ